MEEKFLYYLNNEEPQNMFERLMKITAIIIVAILGLMMFVLFCCYFMCGIFILDFLYWIVSGKTVIWNKLDL